MPGGRCCRRRPWCRRSRWTLWSRVRLALFRLVLRLSTPAHKFFGLDYDAGVSKEIIPVVFSRAGVTVALPELEIVQPEREVGTHDHWSRSVR